MLLSYNSFLFISPVAATSLSNGAFCASRFSRLLLIFTHTAIQDDDRDAVHNPGCCNHRKYRRFCCTSRWPDLPARCLFIPSSASRMRATVVPHPFRISSEAPRLPTHHRSYQTSPRNTMHLLPHYTTRPSAEPTRLCSCWLATPTSMA